MRGATPNPVGLLSLSESLEYQRFHELTVGIGICPGHPRSRNHGQHHSTALTELCVDRTNTFEPRHLTEEDLVAHQELLHSRVNEERGDIPAKELADGTESIWFISPRAAMSIADEALADLDREYSPSAWSRRFDSAQEVIQHHIKFVTDASEDAANSMPHKLEIEYGPTPGQRLDIFGTDLPNDSPILVYVHGGYWQELSREVSRYPAKPLRAARVKTVVVGYDLCPTATLPEIVGQIQNAAKFVFEYAEKMGSKFFDTAILQFTRPLVKDLKQVKISRTVTMNVSVIPDHKNNEQYLSA
ncbi:Kynurenine formamidase [Eumeta japonica]|uniref:Kynurenine formamidase n=1 Tax=Eumeta variegata TaxID=151549 RepID=A0A4C1YS30_EUMVA|nr:Kynurenine formamidase [Eumeta japonica]